MNDIATVTPIAANPAAPASAGGTLTLPPAGTGTPPVTFSVPDAYKDKPWAKGIDSADKLWAMNDGAQELIGKRPAGIPAPDAAQAEWDKFYEATGRPKTAAEYQLDYGKNADGTPKAAPDAKWDAGVKDLMFKYGVPATKAVAMQKDFDAMVGAYAKEKGLAVEVDNKAFSDMSTELFGAQRDKIMAEGKTILTEHVKDPRIAGYLAKLPNEALMVLAAATHSIAGKFYNSGAAPLTPPGSPGTGGTPGGSKDALHAEARRLMTLPEYSNSMHPDNKRILDTISKLYQDASKMQ